MLNLLIVDDENAIIEDIRASIDWEQLGIGKVSTAMSMRQAIEVFGSNPVDIMLCDIEMPQGNGLELLEWVMKNHPSTVAIFLTCHADFGYAKEAIRLGSLDYLLKPIPYEELETTIRKAVEKISSRNEIEEYSRYGHFWFKNQPLLVERFWVDILNRAIPSNQQDIRRAADQRNIPYSEQIRVIPVLSSLKRWHEKMSARDEKVMEFGLKNIAEELFIGDKENGHFIQLSRGILLGILFPPDLKADGEDALAAVCSEYISKCTQYLNCDLSCYIGTDIHADGLADMVNRLLQLERNDVGPGNQVLLLKKATSATGAFRPKDMSLWAAMIPEGSEANVQADVNKTLKELTDLAGLNADTLYQFQQDFAQML